MKRMIQINLLPYREKLQKAAQARLLVQMLVVAIVAALIVGAFHWRVSSEINAQKIKNQQVEQAILALNLETNKFKAIKQERQDILMRLKVIESLKLSRDRVVRILQHWPAHLPEGIHLTVLKHEKGKILFEGLAESHQQVSELMRRLDALPQYQHVVLQHVQSNQDKKSTGLKRFILVADVIQAYKPKGEES